MHTQVAEWDRWVTGILRGSWSEPLLFCTTPNHHRIIHTSHGKWVDESVHDDLQVQFSYDNIPTDQNSLT